jgi:hypothetical protein
MIFWLTVGGGYSAVWLMSARWLLTRWSPAMGVRCTHYHSYRNDSGSTAMSCPTSEGLVTAQAMAASLGWPLILATILVRCHPLKALHGRRQVRHRAYDAKEAELLAEQAACIPGTTLTLHDPTWERAMEDQLGIPPMHPLDG